MMKMLPFIKSLLIFISWPILSLNLSDLDLAAQPYLYILSQHGRLDSMSTEAQYLTLLRATNEKTFKEEIEMDFLLLLDEHQKATYDSLATLNDRKNYIKQYWKASNPNPLLPENDWLMEFLRRRAYAKKNFRAQKPPFIDDRGLYYIKFGKPQIRYEDMGGRGVITNFTTVANEIWSYETVQTNFVVVFIKEGVSYREIKDLTDIVIIDTPKGESDKIRLWSSLIKDFRHVSPVFGRAAVKIENLEDARRFAKSFPQHRKTLAIEYYQPTMILEKIDRETKAEIETARELAPAAARDALLAKNELEIYERVAQFRESGERTRLEITLLSPLKKNLVKRVSESSHDTVRVEFGAMIRDPDFQKIDENRMVSTFPVKMAAIEDLPNAVGNLSLHAQPQEIELTFQVHETIVEKLGFSHQSFTVKDYSGRELMMSDIQFFTEVKNVNQASVLPVSEKQSLQIAPYPYVYVRKAIPLVCYFEVYNLNSAGIKEEYKINYQLVKAKQPEKVLKKVLKFLTFKKDRSISISYNQPVRGNEAKEFITIDLRKISTGPYRLEISVRAKNDAKVNAKVHQDILVVN